MKWPCGWLYYGVLMCLAHVGAESADQQSRFGHRPSQFPKVRYHHSSIHSLSTLLVFGCWWLVILVLSIHDLPSITHFCIVLDRQTFTQESCQGTQKLSLPSPTSSRIHPRSSASP